jgi:acyl transferase domain-containing protein
MDQLANRIGQLSPLQRAAFLVKEAQGKLEALQRAQTEPIAIVGMSCRFPGGANDTESFWRILADGVNAIREIPNDRWSAEAFYDPDPRAPGKMNTRWGGFLDRIDEFDNTFFAISNQEAARMDPQQRLMLELAWEAMEDAGLAPEKLAGTPTSVYVGCSISEYGLFFLSDLSLTDAYVGIGTSLSIIANRISYAYDFRGPSVALDSACSSSLVGVHLACQSLRSGESRCALVGGVNLTLTPPPLINLTKAGFNSADGKCHSFDADATGYVRSEGGGMVVLKTLSAALADNDPIQAVILGSAINQDGHSNGLTAPNRTAQEAVLREAYSRAGVSPGAVQFVETQGTGTLLGDAIEVQALTSVLAKDRPPGKAVAIGSVKTNLGHLEAAAGMAGLIKTVLALKHKTIPANLHFEKPNPHAPFEQLPIEVPTRTQPWPGVDGPALAGVSAFGFGGTNAHLVLQEAPKPAPADKKAAAPATFVLPLSAKTPAALQALAQAYRDLLTAPDASALDLVCVATATGRQQHDQRLAVLGSSTREVVDRLDAYLRGEPSLEGCKPYGRAPKTAFVCGDSLTGWAETARTLRTTNAAFRAVLEKCDQELRPLANGTPCSLLEWLDGLERDPARVHSPAANAGLFALQAAMLAAWRAWGVEPDAILGTGRGEIAAAYAAGVLSLEDGLKAAWRGGKPDGASAHTNPPITAQAPALPLLLAGRLGTPIRDVPIAYWSARRQAPLDLGPLLRCARDLQLEVVLEIGPANARDAIAAWAKGEQLACRALASFEAPADLALPALAALFASGQTIAWDRVFARQPRPIRLPTYPWQRKRFWIDSDRYFPHSFGIADRYGRPVAEQPGSNSRVAPQPEHDPQPQSDWLYELAWEPKPKTWIDIRNKQPGAEKPGGWLVLLDRTGVGDCLGSRLEETGHPCVRLAPDELGALERVLASGPGVDADRWSGIVDLRALGVGSDGELTSASLVEEQTRLCAVISELVCRLVAAPGVGATKLWVATRGAQAAGGPVANTAAVQAALWGLGRTLAQETPRHWGGLVDLDSSATAEASASAILEQITFPDDEMQIAFRADKRYVARLTPRPNPADDAGLGLRTDATYLLTGGLGGLGPVVGRWLIEAGARRLILLGRTQLPPRSNWSQLPADSELGRKAAAVRELEALGASVHLAAVDVADEEKLHAFLDGYRAEGWPAVRGVIHLAEETHLSVIGGFTSDNYRHLFRAKAGGAWALHRALAGTPLDFFVLFSSSSSVLPSPLQGGFGAANAALDALAAQRREAGLPATCVDWSDWSERSLARRALERQQLPVSHQLKGVTNQQGLAILRQLVASGAAGAVVVPLTAEDWLKRPAAPFESRVREEMVRRNPAAAAVRARPELSTPYVAPATDLERFLADLWQTALKIDRVGARDNFFELGGDSLQGAVLLNRLQEGLKEVIHPHVLFETRCVHDLAVYLRKECPAGVKRQFSSEQVGGEQEWDPDWPEFVDEPEVDKARELICTVRSGSGFSTGPGPKNPPAIFILSPPRSGSTLFRVMLAGHPQLFAPPELELLPYETLKERRQSYTDDTVTWLEGADRALMEVHRWPAEEAHAAMRRMEESGMTIKDFYRHLQDAVPGRILVDKTPANATKLDNLRHAELLFDNAVYVHLLRHPCAMILSYVEYKLYQTYVDRFRLRGKFPFAPRQMGELIWLISQRNILKHLEQVPAERQVRVRFEELVTRPDETLRGLCSFLKLPYCPEMAQPYENKETKMTSGTRPEKRMHGDQKFLIAHQGINPDVADRWKEEMSADVLGNPAREMAALLGYADVPAPVTRKRAPASAAPIPRLGSAPAQTAAELDELSEADVDSLLQSMLLETRGKKP